MNGKKTLRLSLAASMILMSSSAQAFEPITTVLGIVGGPLFCKMISCKSTETNTIYVQQPMDPKTVARIEKMKADFKWDTEFCRLSPILEPGEQLCYVNDSIYK